MFNILSAVVNVGSSYVAIIDFVMLGVILFALIFGAIKGFISQILSILGTIASLILAISFCDEIAEFLMTSFPSLADSIGEKISEILGLSDELLSGTKEEIMQSLAQTSIPAFLHELLANSIIETAGDLNLIGILTKWALVAISFVAIFVLSSILFLIVKMLFKGITKLKLIGALDKILGAILMALKFLILIVVIIMIASIFTDMNPILAPTLEDGTVVESVFNSFVSWIMNLEFIQNLFIA